jgi:hypothetical protein
MEEIGKNSQYFSKLYMEMLEEANLAYMLSLILENRFNPIEHLFLQ